MSTVRIECVSLVTTDSKETNLKNYAKYIEDAAANGVNILVLPEYSSTGLPDDISMNYVSKAEKKHFEDNAELIPQGEDKIVADIDPQASIAAYYEAMHLTPEEHLAMLRKQQDKHEKYMALGDVILTNIRFYGSAVLNNVFDFPNMLRYRKRMKR